MDIIKSWLTYKLGLEIPKPEEFEKGLANGVLIAEILRKYGILSDDEFISLRHNNSEKTRLSNIQHIEEWLTGTGVKIKQSDLEDISMEKVGVGMKLLYELYMWFEYGPRTPKVPEESPKGFEFGKDPSSGIPKAENYEEQKQIGSDYYGDLKNKDGQPLQAGHAYTSYDRIEFPRNVTLQKPFVGSSEANQAQHLYLCSRTLDVLRKQEQERAAFARDREHRLKELRGTVELFPDVSSLDQFDAISIRRQQEAKAAAVRDAKLRSVLDDMNKFDSAAIRAESNCESEIPIYADGRGDQCEYENKIRYMKCKRLEKIHDEEERSLIRKQILNRATQNTPSRMRKSLEEDVMGGLNNLPASERLLAAFISRCQQERNNFIQHSIYEAAQVQNARTQDVEKESRIKQQEVEFRQYAASEEANPQKSYNFVCRVLEEPDLIHKLANADETIKDMIQRALKIKYDPPPPTPPSTPTFTHRKRCKEFIHHTGRILVCEDSGESGDPGSSIQNILPEEDIGQQE